MVKDRVVNEAFFADETNRTAFWIPMGKTQPEKVSLPRMLMLLLALVSYVVEAPQTAWELHQEIVDKVTNTTDWGDASEWTLAFE